jgi:hypothetical protein
MRLFDWEKKWIKESQISSRTWEIKKWSEEAKDSSDLNVVKHRREYIKSDLTKLKSEFLLSEKKHELCKNEK